MINKQIKNLIGVALILILGFVFTLSNVTAASNNDAPVQKVKLNILKDNSSGSSKADKAYTPISGKQLIYWRISDPLVATGNEDIESKKLDKLKELEKLSYKKIVEMYGQPNKTEKSDANGVISLDLRSRSLYYFKESVTNDKAQYVVSSFLVNIKEATSDVLEVNSKNTIPHLDSKLGMKKFIKTDMNDGKGLADAWFKVVTKGSDGKYVSVLRNNKDYEVKSGPNGEFEVSNLELDKTYYLVEVKSPTGYSQLAGPVEFAASSSDPTRQVVQTIKNRKNPYETPGTGNNAGGGGGNGSSHSSKGIIIPKTGDIMLLLLVIAGALVSSLGYLLTRDTRIGSKASI